MKPKSKLQVPLVIWVAWCRTCGRWLDETESDKASSELARREHPEHFQEEFKCDVEVIPFRRDLPRARKVKS